MARARTRGEKLRRKRGRPRLEGDREPNGRIERKEADMEATAVVKAQRAKLGIPESAALDPRLGYALGKLRVFGYISEPQFEAGNRYAGDIVRDLRLSGLSIPSARAQNIFAVYGHQSSEEDDDRAEQAKRARYRRNVLRDLLLATGDINTGRRVLSIVYAVCVLDEDCRPHDLPLLVRGLNRLVRHLGVGA